ncbi:carboxypeptidase regulatory-like domain-containing protein [Algoriphagus litoralis]|uniref:carboxypeptidase regulatory-like domain-containing protein n=1 Tax=Algoriphagus litoralis TaxID=2202829 RepID=UPI0013003425|nr:carboxypeptidase regulatory-like domain-containing protein [Algoriphagus litoralis]
MSKNFKFIGLLFFCFQSVLGLSQTSRIAGKVTDDASGMPVQDVHIFIPNTTFQAFSDSSGRFLITGIPEGKWEIQVWGHGWNAHRLPLVLKAGIPKNIEVKLNQSGKGDPIGEVFSKGPPAKLMDQVMEAFVGADFKKREIGLLNTDKLVFEKLEDKSFRVHSIGPIFFSNNETGYLVSTYFQPFSLGSVEKIKAEYSYFELPTEPVKEPAWRKRRMEVYQESPQKYLSDLMTGVSESFEADPNPEVSFADYSGDYLLSFAKPLSVNLPSGKKGQLEYRGEKLAVKFNGAPVNAEELLLTGAFTEMNPIDGIPTNFNADKLIKLANLEKTAETMQERIFVHTDRRHYWPGEMLYFKAYLNYGNPLMAEELSKVLHVELLDSGGYVLMHRVFKINAGVSSGHLSLPDQESGNFILRAYTAWGQNFREADFFQPIQILGHQYEPAVTEINERAMGIGVFSDKQSYEGGEKVKLNVMAFNAAGNPINANLSVTVLDLNQAVAIPEAKSMEESFQPKVAKRPIEEFPQHPETGFTLKGQLLDIGGQAVSGSMKAFINGYTDVRTLGTDKLGNFELPSSNFDGQFEIALQATDRDARPVRNISLAINTYPVEELPEFSGFTAVVPRGIQPAEDIEPLRDMEFGEILMEEAIIEDKREISIGPMIYGQPDRVVKTEDIFLNGTPIQFLYQLAAQVPGMTVYGTPPSVRFRGGEPLVLINGAPVNSPSGGTFGGTGGGQTAYDVISNLDVLSIERVEIIRRLVPQYGDQGRNGLISIILKSGLDRTKAMEANMNNYTIFRFDGYPMDHSFVEIEKYRADFPFLDPYKPTLYWNPYLITEESSMTQLIEFQLNEQSGPIWVEIRGISDLGEPLHGTFLINDTPTKEK